MGNWFKTKVSDCKIFGMQTSGEQSQRRSNVIQISTRRDRRFFLYLSKLVLRDCTSIELHALGEAISIAVNVAEQLDRLGYVRITKIETLTFESEQKNRDGRTFNRKKVKLIIQAARSEENFNNLMKDFKAPPKK
eukprot:TRINITY_DN1549_c0_g3_i2.p1 TRINITY_DN1549_c0_g3~~TRINITY_DN1549_c0_g3_i2.p1  ORF type:complete len:135 (-),score=27.15 TRINITY_DN1549_c0_g3_i2:120-524(-)